MKRNRFLLGSVSGLTISAQSGDFFSRALAQTAGTPAATDRVLVIVNLQGGNDGLNTVVPYGMQQYYRYRPTLGVAPADVLQLNEQVGFNPQLRSLKTMFDRGQVAVVQGVGYP